MPRTKTEKANTDYEAEVERVETGKKPGTARQRARWGSGGTKNPYTDDDYDELDRIFKALSSDLISSGGLTTKQDFILQNCAKWTLEMQKATENRAFDQAKRLNDLIQSNLSSENLRKKDAKPVEDVRIDSIVDKLEKVGLLKDGKQCSPDKMFEILFGRPPKYAYTKDAAEKVLLSIINRTRSNDGLPEFAVLPEEDRIEDELGEFAKEPNAAEKEAYAKLGLIRDSRNG